MQIFSVRIFSVRIFIFIYTIVFCGMAVAQSYPAVDVLSQDTHTVAGEQIIYPTGEAQITAAIIALEPNSSTGWHVHNVPLYAYVIEGTIEVDYGDKIGVKTYVVGDSFMEAMQTRHNGMNLGDTPARILAVFIGAVGVDNTTGE